MFRRLVLEQGDVQERPLVVGDERSDQVREVVDARDQDGRHERHAVFFAAEVALDAKSVEAQIMFLQIAFDGIGDDLFVVGFVADVPTDGYQ